MSIKTVNQAWDEFEKQMIPKKVPSQVRIEMRRIFIYGAHAAVTLIDKPSLLQVGVALEGLKPELTDFINNDK